MLGVLLAAFTARAADRSCVELDAGWKFLHADETNAARADFDYAAWKEISVPHTWNAEDAAAGVTNYFRGACWYARTLPEIKTDGRRAFLIFDGASIVTDVYLNDHYLGQHRGAFGAFCFEITQAVKPGGPNELRVRVDNSRVQDVPPLSGDFVMFGGLYRPVKLLMTSEVCISPLDYASPGVYLSQRKVSRDNASVDVTAKLSRLTEKSPAADVRVTLFDTVGNKVVALETNCVWNGHDGEVKLPLNLRQPHLWHGRKDPYLYSVRTEVLQSGEVVDAVTQPLGLRFYRVDPKLGFILNGEPYPLHGVARHQDRADKGWALSEADHRSDVEMICDIGATAVRLAHYPQSPYFYGLCDRVGLVVWAEIPLVNSVRNTGAFYANTKQQLTELIRQEQNHPSIVVWGLFNELYHDKTDPCEELVGELNTLAKQEDPTRLTTAASNQRTRKSLNNITDLLAFNSYPGWYGKDKPSDMAALVKSWQTNTARPTIAVSEYGAGGSLRQHEEWPPKKPVTSGAWHPEEYQALCHEQQYQALASAPGVWATFAWNMFDFASAKRDEGDAHGRNDKGLVAYDHKTAKDVYYFYKANWNPEPIVHIVSRRFTPREQTNTAVRVYSNCDQVELFVNGLSAGSQKPDRARVAIWNTVALAPGENQIQAVAKKASGEIKDACIWELSPAKPRMAQIKLPDEEVR